MHCIHIRQYIIVDLSSSLIHMALVYFLACHMIEVTETSLNWLV